MINRLLTPLVFLLYLACSAGSVAGAENSSDGLSGKDAREKELCTLIKDNLKRGVDAKSVTKTNVQLGHSVCHVIRCAIDGGGELRLIITGAVEAGSTPDVVTRCCVDAGAEPGTIAKILQSLGEGLGYSPPGDELVPVDPVPTGTAAGRFISPSAF
jgi:hypothetical protein